MKATIPIRPSSDRVSSWSDNIGSEPVYVGGNLRLRQFSIDDASDLCQLHKEQSMLRWLLDDMDLDTTANTTRLVTGLARMYQTYPGLGIWAFERLESCSTEYQSTTHRKLAKSADSRTELLPRQRWCLRGWFNLTPVPENPDYIELGSRLHPSAWGRRIACSVGEQLVHYAFEVRQLNVLFLHCHPLNEPALYCAAYLGFDHPKPVIFLGSDALRLTATAETSQRCEDLSDSARRRMAVARVRGWTTRQ